MKHAWIHEHRDSFPVTVMCQVLQVAPSGYYDSLDREPSRRAQRHERIKQSIQQVYAESYGIYGSLKMPTHWKNATIWNRPAAIRWRRQCRK